MDAARPLLLTSTPLPAVALEDTQAALHSAFTSLDDTFFNLSQSSSKSMHMDALRAFRTKREDLLKLWGTLLKQAFSITTLPIIPSGLTNTLTLMPNDELEKQLAIQQMASLWTKHHLNEVTNIERLLGSGSFSVHTFPLHPSKLSELVGEWIEEVELTTETQLIALKILEREFDAALKNLLPKAVDVLRKQGLRDNAPPPAKPTPPPTWLEQVDTPSSEAASPSFASSSASVSMDAGNGKGHAYGRPHSAPQWNSQMQQMLAQALTELLAAPSTEPSASATGSSPFEKSLFEKGVEDDWNIEPSNWDPNVENLLQALQTRRTRRSSLPAPQSTMSQSAVRSVLDVLQRDLPQSVREVARDDYQSLTKQFKVEMLNKALQIGVRDEHSALNVRDEDAIDIVGMLFEIFLSEREIVSDMRENIAQLVAPYVKVALNDRKMFMHKAHPARRFLDALAQACEGNAGVSSLERNTLNKVSDSIERLVTDFNEDVAIFDLAESEIRGFIAQQKAAVEHSEKRAAEAQKGAERLENAKTRSEQVFAQLSESCQAPPEALAELKKYWTQHHTIALLRHEDVPEVAETSKQMLNQVLRSWEAAASSDQPQEFSDTDAALKTILEASGVFDSAADSVVGQVKRALKTAPLPLPGASTDTVGASPQPSPAFVVELPPINDSIATDPATEEQHQRLVEYFKNMPLGTWVDFVRSDGQIIPTKLSWISPISMRLLFVTARGTKHAVEYVEDLAKLVMVDRVRLRDFGLGEDGFEHSFKRAVEQINAPVSTPDPLFSPTLPPKTLH